MMGAWGWREVGGFLMKKGKNLMIKLEAQIMAFAGQVEGRAENWRRGLGLEVRGERVIPHHLSPGSWECQAVCDKENCSVQT